MIGNGITAWAGTEILCGITNLTSRLQGLGRMIASGYLPETDHVKEAIQAVVLQDGRSCLIISDEIIALLKGDSIGDEIIALSKGDSRQVLDDESLDCLVEAYLLIAIEEFSTGIKVSIKPYLAMAFVVSRLLEQRVQRMQNQAGLSGLERLFEACGQYDEQGVVETILANPDQTFLGVTLWQPLLREIEALRRGLEMREESEPNEELDKIAEELEALIDDQERTPDQTERMVQLRQHYIKLSGGSYRMAERHWTETARIGHLSDETPERELD